MDKPATEDVSNMLTDSISVPHKFVKNSIFNILGFIVTFPTLILLTPYMLKVLGDARFGIWAISGVVLSYAQLSDIGMTTAIVKFVAEHWVKKEVESINSIASTTFFTFAVIGTLVMALLLLGSNFLVAGVLNVPEELQPEAIFMVKWTIIIFYFNSIFSVYNSVLKGLQRMDITNIISSVAAIIKAILMALLLMRGFGLKGLILSNGFVTVLAIAANIIWLKRLLNNFSIKLRYFSFSQLKEIVGYSINVFYAGVSGLIQDPLNKIIISAYISLPFVAFYEIAGRISIMARQIFQTALFPLLPASSELQSLEDSKKLHKIYISLSRILFFIAVPLFVMVIVTSDLIILVWLGENYKWVSTSIQFLLIGGLCSLLVTPQYIILQGIGKPQINTIAHIIATALNLLIAIALVKYIKFYGILIGFLISMIISSIFIDVQFRKIFQIKLSKYLKETTALNSFVFTIFLGILSYFLKNLLILGDEQNLFFLLLLLSLISILVFINYFINEENRIVFYRLMKSINK